MWAEDGSCLPEEASEWNPLCQHLDLRVPSLQHCEKLISVVSSTHLWDFVMAAQTDQDRGQHNLLTTSQFHCPYIHCSLIFSKGLNHCTVQGSLLQWNILPSHHLTVRASEWPGRKTPSYHLLDNTQCQLCWFRLCRKQTLSYGCERFVEGRGLCNAWKIKTDGAGKTKPWCRSETCEGKGSRKQTWVGRAWDAEGQIWQSLTTLMGRPRARITY